MQEIEFTTEQDAAKVFWTAHEAEAARAAILAQLGPAFRGVVGINYEPRGASTVSVVPWSPDQPERWVY